MEQELSRCIENKLFKKFKIIKIKFKHLLYSSIVEVKQEEH